MSDSPPNAAMKQDSASKSQSNRKNIAVFSVVGALVGIGLIAILFVATRRTKRRKLERVIMISQMKNDQGEFPGETMMREPEPIPGPRSQMTPRSIKMSVPLQPFSKEHGLHFHDYRQNDLDNIFEDHVMEQPFDPSTIQTEKTSIWRKRMERDCGDGMGLQQPEDESALSEFVLSTVFNPSTIKSEDSIIQRSREAQKAIEGIEFFNDNPIPDQIVCDLKDVDLREGDEEQRGCFSSGEQSGHIL